MHQLGVLAWPQTKIRLKPTREENKTVYLVAHLGSHYCYNCTRRKGRKGVGWFIQVWQKGSNLSIIMYAVLVKAIRRIFITMKCGTWGGSATLMQLSNLLAFCFKVHKKESNLFTLQDNLFTLLFCYSKHEFRKLCWNFPFVSKAPQPMCLITKGQSEPAAHHEGWTMQDGWWVDMKWLLGSSSLASCGVLTFMTLTHECFINVGISHAREYPQTPILFSVSVFF